MSAAAVTHFIHQGLFFSSPEELLAAALPLLREGLAAGDAVILACRDEYAALLVDAIGPHPRITRLPPVRVCARTATAIEDYHEMVAQRVAVGARRVEVVGEPNDFGANPDAWAECSRFEAICNVTLAMCPLTSTCTFDVGALPEPVIKDLASAHPFLLTPAGRIRNERYVDPATFLRRFAAGPDPVEETSPTVAFAAVTDLHQVAALRNQLRAALDAHEVDLPIMADVVAAVQELVVNGLVHGRPPVRVRLWTPPERLVCTVTDAGPGFDDPVAGYMRPDPDDAFSPGSGTGLWLARQLCDRVETARTPAGFTVRLITSAPAART
ncbi:anti-sigma factor RsbA family regulatory protein [Planosporangium mesophilum]|uniref:Anti-sigma regulatory factor n=1 Tax=Planosporangium mesophilum TaxID=689768 RepID=A0A8J3TCI0_9ACTN|nr:anti-sigma factor RsbA family regulatory protein [Planosporangium mesophilum]NJC82732.1 sensor histidine kinase [Planosporangium mesophilum]GII23799.1 anti-sigma regulatory factor [Planosporangium mesophilum]